MQAVKNESEVIEKAIETMQRLLDKEARNRLLPVLEPRDLCELQKRQFVNAVAAVLDGKDEEVKVFGITVPQSVQNFFARIRQLI